MTNCCTAAERHYLRPPPNHAPLFIPSPAERRAHLPPPAADPHPYSLTGVKMPHSALISSPNPSATPSTTPFPLPSISQQPLAFVLVALLLLHCPEKLKGLQEEGEQTAAKTGDASAHSFQRSMGGPRNCGIPFSNIAVTNM